MHARDIKNSLKLYFHIFFIKVALLCLYRFDVFNRKTIGRLE